MHACGMQVKPRASSSSTSSGNLDNINQGTAEHKNTVVVKGDRPDTKICSRSCTKHLATSMTIFLVILTTSMSVQTWHVLKTGNSIYRLYRNLQDFTFHTNSKFSEHFSFQEFGSNEPVTERNKESTTYEGILPDVDDCKVYRSRGNNISGIYHIDPPYGRLVGGYDVYCDMETDGGGWIVFQRRVNGQVDFYRNWSNYTTGFGDMNHEFWIGNKILYDLTSSVDVTLRIDLWDWDDDYAYAEYSNFTVRDSSYVYQIDWGSFMSGNARNGLSFSKKSAFSTYDHDYQSHGYAQRHHGAWWYASARTNLNGPYNRNETTPSSGYGVIWYSWRGYSYSLRKTEMKFRRSK